MTNLQKVQTRWQRQIDEWQIHSAKSRPIPEEHQSLDGTRDCWNGFVRPLMNMAIESVGGKFQIPDRVSEEQKRQDKRYIGESGIELFGDMSSLIPKKDARIGDVIVFIFERRTHVALVIDRRVAAHATDQGIHRKPLRSVMRMATKVLRYNGPGAEIFQNQ